MEIAAFYGPDPAPIKLNFKAALEFTRNKSGACFDVINGHSLCRCDSAGSTFASGAEIMGPVSFNKEIAIWGIKDRPSLKT